MGIELRGSVLGIATIAGVVTALNWVCTLVVSPLAGRLCDRLGRRVPFLVATLLQGGALLCLAWMEQVLATVVFFTVFFICLNAQKVFLDAAAGDGALEGGANAVSRYNSWQDLGSAADRF